MNQNKIIKLSENIIKQIAAGEIVTRPAGAIKELIENAIDAKATEISIAIENAGLSNITIIDNGIGMNKDDLAICTEMHTTSKTNETDKQFGASSFGFRGEALASIDAISELTIETNGYIFHKNKIITEAVSKKQSGTRIIAKNLFKNLPARLKFVKNSKIENEQITLLIRKFAIQHPYIHWKFHCDMKSVYNLIPTTQETRIFELFNEEPTYFDASSDNCAIHGCVFKNHSKFNAIFVNDRIVKDPQISRYIQGIFKEYFMRHEEPSFIISIDIDSILIDCNVHPAKEEVQFVDYSNIFNALNIGLCESFFTKLNSANVQKTDIIKPMKLEFKKRQAIRKITQFRESEKSQFLEEPLAFQPKQHEAVFINVIGQFKNSYIIFETRDRIGILDQHAAHERQLYQKMKKELNEQSAQQLLLPIKLELSATQAEFLLKNSTIFNSKGIIFKASNDGTIFITHIPNMLNGIDIKHFLEIELSPHSPCIITIDRMLADIACKNALKAKTKLSIAQMETLVTESLLNPPVCNHGRPVFKYFSHNEIDHWFGRNN